ncbi:MAG: hypothetical protein Q4B26_05430 [Eubacteriales bacterium]|nr:hypothetical protein [Eubacteriales bacterium]
MFEKVKPEYISFGKDKFPYVCDMRVLEQIQNKYEDLIVFEDKLLGIEPYFAENGDRDRAKDGKKIPDINVACSVLLMMMEEGAYVTASEITLPTLDELKMQGEYSLYEIVEFVHAEYMKNFIAGRGRKN